MLYPIKFWLQTVVFHPLTAAALLLLPILLVSFGYRRTALFVMWALLALILVFTSRPSALLYNIPLRQNTPASETVRADAIVALGSGIRDNGALRPLTRQRLDTALALYRQGLAPLLVVTGAETKPDETAIRMKRYAEEHGVPAQVIITIPGYTTREESMEAAKRLLQRTPPVIRILLVTSKRHLYRATGAFRKAGFEVHPHAADEHITSCRGWFSWCYAKAFLATTYEYLAISRYKHHQWIPDDH